VSDEPRINVVMSSGMRMCSSPLTLLNGETTMHGAGMQLHWLDQTKGEPERQHSGKSSRDQVAVHESNIG
jgi:hypothetical protein